MEERGMSGNKIEFAWGPAGLRPLMAICDVFIIVDVLCFSSSVDVAVSRGAEVLPYPLGKQGAETTARQEGAVLARPRDEAAGAPSLSPASLTALNAGTRLLLPSPNGSKLSAMAADKQVFAGCLRNAAAVAEAAGEAGQRIAVIAAGEHWPGGSLRPAIEDLLGAGALIARLGGEPSDDARTARAAYAEFKGELGETLRASHSGQELIRWGFSEDVDLAAAEDCSAAVPALTGGSYRNAASAGAGAP